MATTIVTKNGSGAPTASDLVAGELAVDLTNGRLYTTDLDSGGTVIEIGLNPSGNVDVTGTVTADGLTVGDTSDSQSLIQMLANSTDGANTIHFGDGTSADAYVGYINYAHDSNSMQFAAGGSTRATIDGATGNVGIGVSPSTKLHLGGAAPLDSIIRQDSTVSGTNWEIGERAAGKWQIWEDDTDSVVATFTSSGSVGIGTSSPSSSGGKLAVKTANAGYVVIEPTSNVTNQIATGIRLHGNANETDRYAGIFCYNEAANNVNSMTFWTSSSGSSAERMRLDASGNLLVGGTSYEQAGSIGFKGTGEYSSILSSGAGGEIYAGGAIALVSNGYQISVTTGNAQTYKWHNGTTRSMTLDSSGNLLVGTTSSAGKFTLVSNQYNAMSVQVNADGNVGASWKNGAGSEVGYIQVNTSSTLYSTSSDQRLKDNIVDAPSASDDIDAIQVRSFDWKADGSHQKYGMVAQELQTVAPEAVSVPEDPEEMMGVDYSKLVPMMLKEIQSLRARVAQLES